MRYRVRLGTAISKLMSKDEAEGHAEDLWNSTGRHTQVIDQDGVVISEFEA